MRNPLKGHNVVIIGAGVGGLSAGILLSLLDYRVTLVEKNSLPGGLLRSYRRKGLDCCVGVHYVGALGPAEPLGRMFSFLGLQPEALFYRMGGQGVTDRYLFDDFSFDLPVGIDAYEDRLKAAFPSDRAVIDSFMKTLRRVARGMEDPLFMMNGGDPFANLDDFRPMGEYLEDLRPSPGLRAVLAVPCQLIGVQFDDCPVILHCMVLAGYLFSAWRPKVSGSDLADAFARRFTGLGGTLLCGHPVKKISVRDGRTVGVTLDTGETLPADGVVAAVHPKVVLTLLEEEALRPSVRERITSLVETEGVMACQVRVDALAHPQIDHNIYRLHRDPAGRMLDGAFYQIRPGDGAGANLLSVITRSPYSDWRRWEHTRTGHRGADYEEAKAARGALLLQQASEVFGKLSGAEILDVFTPLSLRDWMNCPEGACYGLLRSAGQMLKAASLKNLPVEGLCLAGQNALAPGVLGCLLGSFSVARQIAGESRFREAVIPVI